MLQRILLRRFIRHIQSVGLRRKRHIDDGLRQIDAALRHPVEMTRLISRHRNLHRPAVRHAHILAGGAQDAADGGNHIPRFQQPGQIVERRVRVRAPHGLHEG